jgi:hypothetical protein
MADIDVTKLSDNELRAYIKSAREQLRDQETQKRRIDSIVDKDTLKQMLRREQQLRTSADTQAAYSAAESSGDTDWMEVTINLQKQVVSEFGIPPSELEHALYLLRTAHTHYPDDPEFKEIPLSVIHFTS